MPVLDPIRFSVPLYTVADVARIVNAPRSTVRDWARGYVHHSKRWATVSGRPIITHAARSAATEPSIPFIGLAEAFVLAAIRTSGVPMQRIRPALDRLEQEIGLDHALASRRLYTDGAEILYDFSESTNDADAREVRRLVVIRNNQHAFADVIAQYLTRIEFGPDGYPTVIRCRTETPRWSPTRTVRSALRSSSAAARGSTTYSIASGPARQ